MNTQNCKCEECKTKIHYSDCSVHNELAYQKGPCTCWITDIPDESLRSLVFRQVAEQEARHQRELDRKKQDLMEGVNIILKNNLDWHFSQIEGIAVKIENAKQNPLNTVSSVFNDSNFHWFNEGIKKALIIIREYKKEKL